MVDRRLIDEADKRPEVRKLRKQMYSFRPLFDDMAPAEYWWPPYDLIALNVRDIEWLPGEDGIFNEDYWTIDINTKTGKHCGPKLLHEMIHMHENGIDKGCFYPAGFREQVEDQLRANLSKKVDIEYLLSDAYGCYVSVHEMAKMENAPEGAAEEARIYDINKHDSLFFLKSIDLDLKRRYKLGTVYGYGMRDFIENVI